MPGYYIDYIVFKEKLEKTGDDTLARLVHEVSM